MALEPQKNKPGVYLLDGRREIEIADYYEDNRYDTVAIVGSGGASILTAGQSWVFFRDTVGKDLIDYNLSKKGSIARGQEMIVNSIGLHIGGHSMGAASLILNEVFHWIAERMYLVIKINSEDVGSGPVMMFQPGVGVSGSTNDAAPNGGVLNNGVPSLASVRPLLVSHEITSDHDIDATLYNFGANWLANSVPLAGPLVMATVAAANAVAVKLILNGYIKRAVGRH